MKNSDIALVVLVALVSIGLSYWLGNMLLGDPSNDTYEITSVEAISSELKEPDSETFYPGALNPTDEVIIGNCKEGQILDPSTNECVEDKSSEKKDDSGKSGGEEINPEPSPEE